MGVERLDRAQRQEWAEAEGDIGGAPDFGAGCVDRERKALAAECLWAGHRVPAGMGPALVGIGPPGRGGHLVRLELDAMFVAHSIQGRQYIGGKTSGFLQHGSGDIAVEIAIMAGFHGGLKAGAMIEGQQHVVDRRAIGHDLGLALTGKGALPSSHETTILSTPRGRQLPRRVGRRGTECFRAVEGRPDRQKGPCYKDTKPGTDSGRIVVPAC
jgi:hypothetical protein